jgi:hypothetical protein
MAATAFGNFQTAISTSLQATLTATSLPTTTAAGLFSV